MARPHEYIGVSGVVDQEQQAQLEEMFAEFELRKWRQLQLGVKATHKPQWLEIENKYGREWYPVGNEITNALRRSSMTVGVAQVCFDSELVYDPEYRRSFLLSGPGKARLTWLDGIQFDMLPDWCNTPAIVNDRYDEAMLRLEDSTKELSVLLQCQAEIMQYHTPAKVVEALAGLAVDYVLFDASGGRGVRMDTDALLPYIEAVRNRSELDSLGVAVGGGLNAEAVRSELPKILRHFPDVSWDAEGRLHPVNVDGKRPLDMRACHEYLEASAEVLR
ncbi:MAG: hypothetical protein WBP12_02055 [Candidatus Saccharimonas sp.]